MKKDLTGSILEVLALLTAKALTAATGMDGERAKRIGDSVAAEFAHSAGGITLYIPRGTVQKLKTRDAEIHQKFTGFNITELALEYALSEMRIRQILAQKRK